MSKRRYEGEQTKKHIVEKAKDLFSRKGYTATSIQDVCAAAGVSKGNLYYHFKSKEDLFIYLEEQNFAELSEQWEKISSQFESIIEKLYAYGDFVAGIERPLHSIEREFINTVGFDSEAGQKLFAIINTSFEKFKKFMSEGIATGELKDENLFELTFIVSSFYSGLSRYSSLMDNDAKKALFHKATTLLLQGISTRNET